MLLLSAGLASLTVVAHGLRTSHPDDVAKRSDLAVGGDANLYKYAILQGVDRTSEWPPLALADLPPLQLPSSSESFSELRPEGAVTCAHPRQKSSEPAWRQHLPSAKAAREAVGSEAFGSNACGHLGLPVGQQYDAVVGQAPYDLWVWTVANSVYGDILADWQLQMRRVGAQRVLIVSVDAAPEWAASLCALGFHVIDTTEAGRLTPTVGEVKFQTPAHFVRLQAANAFLELDIFWQRAAKFGLPDLWNSTEGADVALAAQFGGKNTWINIGFWMSPGTASPHLAEVFELAWRDGGSSWDQRAFNNVAQQCCKVLKVRPKFLRRRLACTPEMRNVTVVTFMDNTVVNNWYYKSPSIGDVQQDRPLEPTIGAVHIWARTGPMSKKGGFGKVVVAKNAGLFEGAGCYYEQCDSGERYLAWDGILPGGAESRVAMRLLLTLGLATNRTVILPRVAIPNGTTFGEKLFDETEVGLGRATRESSFLHHPFLPKAALYPVARLALHDASRSSVQLAASPRESSVSRHRLAGGAPSEESAGRSLLALAALPSVAASKTALFSVPLGLLSTTGFSEGGCGDLDKDVDSKLVQCELKTDRNGETTGMRAHEVCR